MAISKVASSEVRRVIDTRLEDDQVNAAIDTAHLIIIEQLTNQGMSDDRLERIEVYLAAHFVAVNDQQIKTETFGGSTTSYQGRTYEESLLGSKHGQTAIDLDQSGILSQIGKPPICVEAL